MNFLEVRSQYNKLREEERNKISKYLRNHDDFKNATVKAKRGSYKYKSGKRLEIEYDLSNWLWIDITINDVNFLISLQTFDQDPNTGNFHVLVDRIGIYAYGGDYSADDAHKNMMITNIELPIDDNKLEKLANIVKDLSECEFYKMQSQVAKMKNQYKMV
ncbi:MAG: hypothetical protein SOV61_00360 [Lachnospiraceae bacterium]|nr:hypothetical protein [Lachnospiraceae bacterium]MDY2697995.1 hypothetical protein [Lachnospiraceae bacterium]MDY5520675.1 hypothetical protein [Agathobacter sp.]